ncbi:unnamed protein product, partial [Pylaiella littoralis]
MASLPRTARKTCICTLGDCCTNDGTVRLLLDAERRTEWFRHLGVDASTYHKKDGRVALSHFHERSCVAANVVDPNGDLPKVGIVEGAIPVRTREDIREARRGSLTAHLRASAQVLSFKRFANRQRGALASKDRRIATMEAKLAQREEALRDARASGSETGRGSSGGPSRERARPVEYTILGGL